MFLVCLYYCICFLFGLVLIYFFSCACIYVCASTDIEEQLAARIAVSNLHKTTKKSFSETWVCWFKLNVIRFRVAFLFENKVADEWFWCRAQIMYNYVNKKTGKVASLIADDVYEIIIEVVSPFQLFILILSIVFFFYWQNYQRYL